LQINASRDGKLAGDLRIAAFPTMVVAGPGRKILYIKEGYHDADTFLEVLQKNIAQVVVAPDWMKQHFDLAQKAFQDGDFARSASSLKYIMEEGKGKAIHAQAQKLYTELEAKSVERLARAKELITSGKTGEATQALTDTLVTFPGLPAA